MSNNITVDYTYILQTKMWIHTNCFITTHAQRRRRNSYCRTFFNIFRVFGVACCLSSPTTLDKSARKWQFRIRKSSCIFSFHSMKITSCLYSIIQAKQRFSKTNLKLLLLTQQETNHTNKTNEISTNIYQLEVGRFVF